MRNLNAENNELTNELKRIEEANRDKINQLGNGTLSSGSNNTVDFALAEDHNIIGEVIFKIPKLGYVQEVLASRGGLIIFIFIPCLAVLSYDIVKLGKNASKKKKKRSTTVVRR